MRMICCKCNNDASLIPFFLLILYSFKIKLSKLTLGQLISGLLLIYFVYRPHRNYKSHWIMLDWDSRFEYNIDKFRKSIWYAMLNEFNVLNNLYDTFETCNPDGFGHCQIQIVNRFQFQILSSKQLELTNQYATLDRG